MPKNADLEREVTELKRRLDEEVGALQRLVEIAALLNSTLKLDELLQLIMRSATDLLHAEASSLLLVDEETGDLTFEVSAGKGGEDVAETRVPAGQGIAGWVVENGQPLIVDDPQSDNRFYAEVDRATGFQTRNILAVPLKIEDRVIGVVEVINKQDGGTFSNKDLTLGLALTSQAAIAIENARLYGRLADAVVTSRMSYRF
jgi:sigma-B regulation protein RsbU (phosphoserine phosphatase)